MVCKVSLENFQRNYKFIIVSLLYLNFGLNFLILLESLSASDEAENSVHPRKGKYFFLSDAGALMESLILAQDECWRRA